MDNKTYFLLEIALIIEKNIGGDDRISVINTAEEIYDNLYENKEQFCKTIIINDKKGD